MDTTQIIHRIIESYVQAASQKLSQSLLDANSNFEVRSKTWSNNSGIVIGYLSVLPHNNPAEQSIDAVISVAPLQDKLQLAADICWSDGTLLVDVLGQEINSYEIDNIKLFCQAVIAEFLQELPGLVVNHKNGEPRL